MKIRVALLSVAFGLSALFSHAADPAVDALVARIQANPAEAAAATAEAVAANQALASELLKAAFEAAPSQTLEILKATVAATPELAPTAVKQALVKLTAGLDSQAAAKAAGDATAAAIGAIPATTPPGLKKKHAAAITLAAIETVPAAKPAIVQSAITTAPDAAHAIEKIAESGRSFPPQRPPITVSPSN